MKSILCCVVLGVVSAPVLAEVMCSEPTGFCVGQDQVLRAADRMEDCGANSDWIQLSALKPYDSIRLVDADGVLVHEYEKCVNYPDTQNNFPPTMPPHPWQHIETKQGYRYFINQDDGLPTDRIDAIYFESPDCSGNAWQVESHSEDPYSQSGGSVLETSPHFFYIPGSYSYYTPKGEQRTRLTGESADRFIKSRLGVRFDENMAPVSMDAYECSEYSLSAEMIHYLSPVYVNDPDLTGAPFVTAADALALPLRVEKIPTPRRAALPSP